MLGRQEARPGRACGGLAVGLARSEAEVAAAQRLRYAVFADELGARLSGPAPGLDEDRFDRFCEHPDLAILLPLARLDPRYARRLFRDAEAPAPRLTV
jgi:putative hemolysin